MAKISQAAAKYIIHASLQIEGVVDKPDIIGAVFGQTEGLLGSDLELRELQRNGRIGRIEVTTSVKSGKTSGEITIPSSLDKSETCIIGAAMEIIERIGPCNSKIRVQKIEDIRVSKRDHVVVRAKELLKNLMDSVMPDSQEISEEVAESVRVMEITTYGKEKIPAGPSIEDSDEILIVEGRADVLNLLKHGIKNAIAVGGTGVPKTIVDLSKEKTVTVFVDGDRGGNLIIRELGQVAEIDFVTKAPDGKEVEEITAKEINKALRSKVTYEQAISEMKGDMNQNSSAKPVYRQERSSGRTNNRASRPSDRRDTRRPRKMKDDEKKEFKKMGEELVGTRGAFILDESLNILGKVPTSELENTVKSLNGGVYAVVCDCDITKELVEVCEKARLKFLIGMEMKDKVQSRVETITLAEL